MAPGDLNVKTHFGRLAAKQMGKQRGAVESDIKEHGLRSAMSDGATQEEAIPKAGLGQSAVEASSQLSVALHSPSERFRSAGAAGNLLPLVEGPREGAG